MNGNSGTRRHFCSTVAFSAIAGSLSPSFASSEKEHAADVVIIGGGLGGCAAAIGALRNGLTVVMTEATDWIGGQLTSQGVPPDEHRWIETTGANRSYRELRSRIRQYYRKHYPLTDADVSIIILPIDTRVADHAVCDLRVVFTPFVAKPVL